MPNKRDAFKVFLDQLFEEVQFWLIGLEFIEIKFEDKFIEYLITLDQYTPQERKELLSQFNKFINTNARYLPALKLKILDLERIIQEMLDTSDFSSPSWESYSSKLIEHLSAIEQLFDDWEFTEGRLYLMEPIIKNTLKTGFEFSEN